VRTKGECKPFPTLELVFAHRGCGKNYDIWLAMDKVIVIIDRLTFWSTLYTVSW